MKSETWLLEFARNVYSQTGEDGILEKILGVLPEKDNWCVEFGAWDGQFLTNTRHLIESYDYSAVLIEANQEKFERLKLNYQGQSKVFPINALVGFSEENNLDKILKNTPIPSDFDVLSIDIDGNDFHAWRMVSAYRPKVVVIEFNPTIPTPVRFVQEARLDLHQGSSLLSLVELGKIKGYELVCVLPWNAFFVKKEFFSLFEISNNAPERLRTDTQLVTYLFSGFDGTVFLRGHQKLFFHDLELQEHSFQALPAFLRQYPGYYTKQQKSWFGFYKILYRQTVNLRSFLLRVFGGAKNQ
jgi:hypothetical protein